MGGFSIWHWIIVFIYLAILYAWIAAGARILKRLGFSGWWVLLSFLPIANIVGLWALSKADWPNLNKNDDWQP